MGIVTYPEVNIGSSAIAGDLKVEGGLTVKGSTTSVDNVVTTDVKVQDGAGNNTILLDGDSSPQFADFNGGELRNITLGQAGNTYADVKFNTSIGRIMTNNAVAAEAGFYDNYNGIWGVKVDNGGPVSLPSMALDMNSNNIRSVGQLHGSEGDYFDFSGTDTSYLYTDGSTSFIIHSDTGGTNQTIAEFDNNGNVTVPNGYFMVAGGFPRLNPNAESVDVRYGGWDAGDHIRYRIAGASSSNAGVQWAWYDDSAGTTTQMMRLGNAGELELPNGPLTLSGNHSIQNGQNETVFEMDNASAFVGGTATGGTQIEVGSGFSSLGGDVRIPSGSLAINGGSGRKVAIKMGTTAENGIRMNNTDSTSSFDFLVNGTSPALGSAGSLLVYNGTSGKRALEIDTSDNVFIPNGNFTAGTYKIVGRDFQGNGDGRVMVSYTDTNGNPDYLVLNYNGDYNYVRVDSPIHTGGNLILGADNTNQYISKKFTSGGGNTGIYWNDTNARFEFYHGSSTAFSINGSGSVNISSASDINFTGGGDTQYLYWPDQGGGYRSWIGQTTGGEIEAQDDAGNQTILT